MFIPIEGAVATALTHAPHLMEEGLRRGIIIASPSTLLVGLKVVETLWKRERRWEGVAEVGEMATQLYNKMALFLKELEKVERGLNSALKGLEGAKGKLTSPRSGILRQLERLREKAGAEGTKELPKGYQVN
jgi:DNA recombination protein RmuC